MNYVDYCYKLYKVLEKTEYDKIEINFSDGFNSFISSITKNISWDELKKHYRREIREAIDENLSFFKNDIELFRKLEDISYYEDSISAYTSIYLFWIWNSGIDFPRDLMDKLAKSVFTGTIGYRLLDVHTDSEILGKEAIVLGNYMIRSSEEAFMEVFDARQTIRTFNRHVKSFTEVEFLEKRNMWKQCPFTWENARILGQKASPLFAIFELILQISNVDSEKIRDLTEGLIYTSAGIQMMDDLSDCVVDLTNGIETLAMSGFYQKYGTNIQVTKELVESFITKDRLLQIYDTCISLFDKARSLFTKHDDDMLLLFLEIQNFKLNIAFETADEEES